MERKRRRTPGKTGKSTGGWLLTNVGSSASTSDYILRSDSRHTPTIHRFSISTRTFDDESVGYRLVPESYPTSFIEFTLSADNDKIFDIKHCYTPSVVRGRGIAKEIVEISMLYAASSRYAIKCSCSYVVDTFMSKSAEFLGSAAMKETTFYKEGEGGGGELRLGRK